jgi:hypothetical protein
MIDEKECEALRQIYYADPKVMAALVTLAELWVIARAARKWVRASAGSDSATAENELVEALAGMKGV